ncbi:MAG TPA: polysaccharide pyruvyl transferase family protein [Chitinispirillaceae bacterium]|nr:polysaccharide pyruvyl transferase family protein [Chitinispirillaceae bacterium]
MPVKIGISGSYGGLNLGDEAILQSIITQIRSSIESEITVFTRSCDDTLSRHDVDHAISSRQLAIHEITPEIENLDILIIGGGGLLYDADARVYLREAVIACEKNIPVMIYAVGAGPLKEPTVQEHVKKTLNKIEALTVRDRRSQQILEESGVQRQILVTADPALLLKPEPVEYQRLRREGISGKKHIVGMSVREVGAAAPDLQEEHYHALLANAADYMIERFDADIIFIPMEPRTFDLQHSHAVISRMLRPQRASVLQGTYTSGQVLAIIKRCEFVVGMRLHFLIFSAIQGVPFVALPYSPKVAGFLDDMHMEMPPINYVNEGRLMAYIDRSWDQREELRNQIKTALPTLQKRAMQNNAILMDIIQRKLYTL